MASVDVADFRALTQQQLINATGYSKTCLRSYSKDGMPGGTGPGKRYDLHIVIQWLIEHAKARTRARPEKDLDAEDVDLQKEKIKKEIEYKSAQIRKIDNRFIERTTMENILNSRASSLGTFLAKSADLNATEFVGLSLDEARVRLYQYAREMMRVYSGGDDGAKPLRESQQIDEDDEESTTHV